MEFTIFIGRDNPPSILVLPIRIVNSNYTATELDYTISVIAIALDVTITLPSPSGIIGRCYIIKQFENTNSNAVIITVDGASAIVQDKTGAYVSTTSLSSLGNTNDKIMFQSNGERWEYIK